MLPAAAPLGLAATPAPLRVASLAAYAAFALPLLMTALPLSILLADFYAAHTALSLSAVGAVLLATRLVDAVADPLLGAWVDLQKARGAYLRPVALGAPALAAGFALVFFPPAATPWITGIWLFCTLVLAYLGFSLAGVAYQAWGAALARDDAGRARVTAAREGVGLLGVLAGGSLPLVLGHGATALLLALLLAGGTLLLARAAPRPPAAPRAQPVRRSLLSFAVPLAHGNARALLALFATNAAAPSITATVFIFFVADRLQLPQHAPWFLAVYFIAGAAGMPLWARLARRYSLHALWLLGMLAAVAAFVWAYWVPPGAVWAFMAICALSGLAFGADLALPPALLARVIDTNGHLGRHEGAYFGLWNFVNKLVLAAAGAAALALLEGLGYARGARDAQALAAVYALLPCALKLAAAAALSVAWWRRAF